MHEKRRNVMPDISRPSLLGLEPSFGFGDRLGLATPGHIRACRKGAFQPIYAQQSVREMTRTQRTPNDVMRAAQEGIREEGWDGVWGADADHLKTREDVESLAAAGFTFFTVDPSAHVDNNAETYVYGELTRAVEQTVVDGAFVSVDELESLYLGETFEVEGATFRFDRETLYRAAAKYGRAVAYTERMASWIAASASPTGYEIEMSVDETDTPTRPLEHLLIAQELRRRNVPVVSLAPRFVGDFEKGVDYKGDRTAFESSLRTHVAIARQLGPYKISVHSGSDKFSIYPILGRVCGNLLHVKTAGTSYLEALRVVARCEPELFRRIVAFSMSRFETDRASYHISANLSRVPSPDALSVAEREAVYLDEPDGRQVMHVTFGSVLTDPTHDFRARILDVLTANAALHADVLEAHLGRHIEQLQAG
jgi:hypothetical protein